MEEELKTADKDTRIVVAGSLLQRAKKDDVEAIKTIFKQFVPPEETIFQAEYFGYFGFWFVGRHSFSCLTDKRIAALRVGPFKKIVYEDGFYENMTSGGVYQPFKFWLYIYLIVGLLGGFIFITYGITFVLEFLLIQLFDLYELAGGNAILIFSGLISLFLLPFIGSFIIMAFYRFNPCGLACWVRERRPVSILVRRERMKRANKFYRIWSNLREERKKYVKAKFK